MSNLVLEILDHADDDSENFEKIRRNRDEGRMPVSRSNAAKRAAYKTAPSRRTSRNNSRRNSGMHHRRRRDWNRAMRPPR